MLYICNRKSENSSVGRAQPCQGWGRGFESRFSLFFNVLLKGCPGGGIGRHVGLKIQWPLWPCRFESGPGYSQSF